MTETRIPYTPAEAQALIAFHKRYAQPEPAAEANAEAEEQADVALGLGDLVRLPSGVEAIVTRRSTCDCTRFEAAWYHRVNGVQRKFYDRAALVLVVQGYALERMGVVVRTVPTFPEHS